MANQYTRRRFLKWIGVSAPVLFIGCEETKDVAKESGETIGDATKTVGELVLLIPHPIAKAIGVLLVVTGEGIKAYAKSADGEEYEVPLTAEEQRVLKSEWDSLEKVKIKTPDGSTSVVPVEKREE